MKFFSEETNVTESGIIYDVSFRRIETDLSKLLRRSNFKSRLIAMDFFKLYNFFFISSHKSRSVISGGCPGVTGRLVFFSRPRETPLI